MEGSGGDGGGDSYDTLLRQLEGRTFELNSVLAPVASTCSDSSDNLHRSGQTAISCPSCGRGRRNIRSLGLHESWSFAACWLPSSSMFVALATPTFWDAGRQTGRLDSGSLSLWIVSRDSPPLLFPSTFPSWCSLLGSRQVVYSVRSLSFRRTWQPGSPLSPRPLQTCSSGDGDALWPSANASSVTSNFLTQTPHRSRPNPLSLLSSSDPNPIPAEVGSSTTCLQ